MNKIYENYSTIVKLEHEHRFNGGTLDTLYSIYARSFTDINLKFTYRRFICDNCKAKIILHPGNAYYIDNKVSLLNLTCTERINEQIIRDIIE